MDKESMFEQLMKAESLDFPEGADEARGEFEKRMILFQRLEKLPMDDGEPLPSSEAFRAHARDFAKRKGLMRSSRDYTAQPLPDERKISKMPESSGSGFETGGASVKTGWMSSQSVTPHFAQSSSSKEPESTLISELKALGIRGTTQRIKSGEISAHEVALAFRERARAVGGWSEALEYEIPMERSLTGDLSGIPIIVKSLFWVKGIPSTAGSRMLSRFIPGRDAAVVAALRGKGADISFTARTDEFAMGGTGRTCAWGRTKHPFLEGRLPGGSSSGSACALSLGMGLGALGSDTGGSVRLPASHCGLWGLKTTRGELSRDGMVAYAFSLDTPGMLAGSAEDLSILHETMSEGVRFGRDPSCQGYSRTGMAERVASREGVDVKGLRIGIPSFLEGMAVLDERIRRRMEEILSLLSKEGAHIERIPMPDPEDSTAAYYLLAATEAQSSLARMDPSRLGFAFPEGAPWEEVMRAGRGELLGTECKLRILLGSAALAKDERKSLLARAQRARREICSAYATGFSKVDLILMPTSPGVAPLESEPFDAEKEWAADALTIPASMAGICAVSAPWGKTAEGEPFGMQLQAPWHHEDGLLSWAAEIDKRVR